MSALLNFPTLKLALPLLEIYRGLSFAEADAV